jgi:hypothetical protein
MKHVYLILAIVIVLVGGTLYYNQQQDGELLCPIAGVGGEPYNSTTTTGEMPQPYTLKSEFGMLGSVIITKPGEGFTLYNATTSDVSTDAGSPGNSARKATSSLILATIPAGTATGTYVYDLSFTDGLLLDYDGTTARPTSTITWR